MDQLKEYLKTLREVDYENYDHLKDFLEFVYYGYDIAASQVSELQIEVEKLRNALKYIKKIAEENSYGSKKDIIDLCNIYEV